MSIVLGGEVDGVASDATLRGDGADVFGINPFQSNLLEADVDVVTDFETDVDTVSTLITNGASADEYFESVYADYDAFIADAAVQMSSVPADQIVARSPLSEIATVMSPMLISPE